MNRLRTIECLLLGGFLCSGCASLTCRTPGEATPVYPGVRADVLTIAHPTSDPPFNRTGNVICGIFDLPFSAVLDTLLLPIDLSYHPKKHPPDSEESK